MMWAINWKYGNSIIMQKNMETEQLSGISALHQQKKTICNWQASKEYLKKITIFRDFKGYFGFIN